jgi:anti-anti-sigma factor
MELLRDGRVLVLDGPLDGRSTALVREAIQHQLSVCGEGVVVDLSAVPWIDVNGLRMLAAATRHAEKKGQSLILRGCTPHMRRVLRHSRLYALLELEGDAAGASSL